MNLSQLLRTKIDYSTETIQASKEGFVVCKQKERGLAEKGNSLDLESDLLATVEEIKKRALEGPSALEEKKVFKNLCRFSKDVIEAANTLDYEKGSQIQRKVNDIVHHVLLSKWSHSHQSFKEVIEETCDDYWKNILFEGEFFKDKSEEGKHDLEKLRESRRGGELPFCIVHETLCIDESFFQKPAGGRGFSPQTNCLQKIETILKAHPEISFICLQNGFLTPCKLPDDIENVKELFERFWQNPRTFEMVKGKNSTCMIPLNPQLVEKSKTLSNCFRAPEKVFEGEDEELLREREPTLSPCERDVVTLEIDDKILRYINAHIGNTEDLHFEEKNLPLLLEIDDYLQLEETWNVYFSCLLSSHLQGEGKIDFKAFNLETLSSWTKISQHVSREINLAFERYYEQLGNLPFAFNLMDGWLISQMRKGGLPLHQVESLDIGFFNVSRDFNPFFQRMIGIEASDFADHFGWICRLFPNLKKITIINYPLHPDIIKCLTALKSLEEVTLISSCMKVGETFQPPAIKKENLNCLLNHPSLKLLQVQEGKGLPLNLLRGETGDLLFLDPSEEEGEEI